MNSNNDDVVTTSEFRDLTNDIESSLNKTESISINQVSNNNSIKSSDNKKGFYYGYKERIVKYVLILIFFIVLLGMFVMGYQKDRFLLVGSLENAKVNYSVCLKENEYYKDNCLDEGREYITALTDYIRLDYNYTKVYQQPVTEEYEYFISSKVEVLFDNENARELYNDERQLTQNRKVRINDANVLNIVDSVDLPVATYDDYIKNYFNIYGVQGNAYLKIALYLVHDDDVIETSSVKLPLKDQTYHIDKTEIIDKNDTYQVGNMQMIHYVSLVMIVITSLIIIFLLYRLIRLISKATDSTSTYEKKLKQILNTYDKVIVSLKDNNVIVNDKPVYTVESFLELLDVRDTVDKPILCYKVNSVKTEFYVQDVDRIYKYTLKEADFAQEK